METRHRAIFQEIEEALATQRAPVSAKIRFMLRKVWQHWLEPGWGAAFRLMLGEMSVEFPALFRTWAADVFLHGLSVTHRRPDGEDAVDAQRGEA